MKKILITIVMIAMMVGATGAAEATIVTLQPLDGKDAEVASGGFASTNFGGDTDLTTNWGGSIDNKGLVEFDLSSIMGAIINNATLGIHHASNAVPGASFGIYRITQSWTESVVTWNARPTTVASPDSILNIADSAAFVWRYWDITSLAQSWTSGANSNYGMMLSRIDQANPVAYFTSSDSTDLYAPKLTIDYSESVVPEPASMVLVGLGLIGFLKRRKV